MSRRLGPRQAWGGEGPEERRRSAATSEGAPFATERGASTRRGDEGASPSHATNVAQSTSMKMHSPGHSSADSIVASSIPGGTLASPSGPPGSEKTLGPSLT